MDKRERCSIETLGDYEYDSKERLGYGAFAIVFKGWVKDVSTHINKKDLFSRVHDDEKYC